MKCFKWAVLAVLHHKEIGSHPERIAKLWYYENICNWNGLEFPMEFSKIGRFQKNNSDIAVNMLYVNQKEGKKKQG